MADLRSSPPREHRGDGEILELESLELARVAGPPETSGDMRRRPGEGGGEQPGECSSGGEPAARTDGGCGTTTTMALSPHGDGESFERAVSAAMARVAEAHGRELQRLRRQLAARAEPAAAARAAAPPPGEACAALGPGGATRPSEDSMGSIFLSPDVDGMDEVLPGEAMGAQRQHPASASTQHPGEDSVYSMNLPSLLLPGMDGMDPVVPVEAVGGQRRHPGSPPGACGVWQPEPPRVPRLPLSTHGVGVESSAPLPPPITDGNREFGTVTPATWQWEHRTGWRDYHFHESEKIEKSFKRGASKVLLKSGKQGRHPMEVFFNDMVQHDHSTRKVRKVRRKKPLSLWERLRRCVMTYYHAWVTGRPRDESFHNHVKQWDTEHSPSGALKTQSLVHKVHSGIAALTHSPWFHLGSSCLIFLNAMWILYEVDHNDALEPSGCDPGFLVVENTFCSLFLLDVLARFASFVRIQDCCSDYWFLFDCCCTFAYMFEMWLIPLLNMGFGDDWKSGNAMPLSFLRVMRLFRLARVTRLVRVAPEFVIILKGFFAAIRNVMYTLVLWFGVVYLCAVSFRSQVVPDGDLEAEYFSSVGHAICTLTLHGTLLDNVSKVAEHVYSESIFLTTCFVAFVFATNCAILNMLIGIICNVVTDVQEQETDLRDREQLTALMRGVMEVYDKDSTDTLCKDEFELFVSNPEVREVLKEFSVDVWGLRSMVDIVSWQHQEVPGSMHLADVMELILRMRSGGSVRLLDVLELRHVVEERLGRLEERLGGGPSGLVPGSPPEPGGLGT